MKLVQAVRKLRTNSILGWNTTTELFDDLGFLVILETSQRWISENPRFSSSRVILSEDKIPEEYRLLMVGDNNIPYIIYSEQKNIRKDKSFVYDYTVLDQTDIAEVIEIEGVQAASGQIIDTVETILNTTPVHMARFGSTGSNKHDDADFTRLTAFLPLNIPVDTDNELKVGSEYFQIDEVNKDLYATRLQLIKR